MKTIVLATDFSPSANRAARFAAQLAFAQHAQLILLHANQAWPDLDSRVYRPTGLA